MEGRTNSAVGSTLDQIKCVSTDSEVMSNSIWIYIATLIGGATAGATGYYVFAWMGFIIGIVIGGFIGGIEGKSIINLIRRSQRHCIDGDTYTTRLHHRAKPSIDDPLIAGVAPSEVEQVPRESWHHLDQSSKDLIARRDSEK